MRIPFISASALILLLSAGCGDSGVGGESGIEGAWLGEGTFHADAGTQDMKAQLEILSDGTYRFMVIEPRVLMLMGAEEGDWTRADRQLDLTPTNNDSGGGGGLLARAPRNFQPKSLTIGEDNDALVLLDDKMEMRFEPNAEATKKLRQGGEVD